MDPIRECLPKARTYSTKLVLISNALTQRFVKSGLPTQESNQMRMKSVSLTYLLHPSAYGLFISHLQLSGPSSLTGPECGIWHRYDISLPTTWRDDHSAPIVIWIRRRPQRNHSAPNLSHRRRLGGRLFPATKYPD